MTGAEIDLRRITSPMSTSRYKSVGLLVRFAAGAFCSCVSLSAIAQTTTAPAAPSPGGDKPIELSAFEVEMSQSAGYNATNAGSALKTGERLLQIPQSVSVITRDMIDDVGSFSTSDTLNYSGVGNFYQGDSAVIRGVRAGMMTDGAADTNFDNISLDSITVLRGPIGELLPPLCRA